MREKPQPFVICALWIYPCKDRTMRRILNDGLYYFNDYITISSSSDSEEIIVNEKDFRRVGLQIIFLFRL